MEVDELNNKFTIREKEMSEKVKKLEQEKEEVSKQLEDLKADDKHNDELILENINMMNKSR